MAPNGTTPNDPFTALSDTLSLVYDSLAKAEKGLLKNPTKEEERKLNRTILKLELERTEIRAKMKALIAGATDVAEPTAAQVAEVSRLTAEAEALTNANLTASAAITLSANVLTVASEIADA